MRRLDRFTLAQRAAFASGFVLLLGCLAWVLVPYAYSPNLLSATSVACPPAVYSWRDPPVEQVSPRPSSIAEVIANGEPIDQPAYSTLCPTVSKQRIAVALVLGLVVIGGSIGVVKILPKPVTEPSGGADG
jgi:hypothetical protein